MTTKGRNRREEARALARSLAAARALGPLTAEQERTLGARARAGDRPARDELVRRNLPLVVAFVRKQALAGVQFDEVVQEGNLGLLRAVEKYDPDAGTRFATYATWWIRAYVWKYLKAARSAVRPKSGTAARADLSLDAPIGEEGDASHLDQLEDEAPTPDARYADADADASVRRALDRVKGRLGGLGWDIVQSRLRQDAPETLETVGRRWGVSRERVRQVEVQTKRFLRGYLQPLQDEREAA